MWRVVGLFVVCEVLNIRAGLAWMFEHLQNVRTPWVWLSDWLSDFRHVRTWWAYSPPTPCAAVSVASYSHALESTSCCQSSLLTLKDDIIRYDIYKKYFPNFKIFKGFASLEPHRQCTKLHTKRSYGSLCQLKEVSSLFTQKICDRTELLRSGRITHSARSQCDENVHCVWTWMWLSERRHEFLIKSNVTRLSSASLYSRVNHVRAMLSVFQKCTVARKNLFCKLKTNKIGNMKV